MRGRTDVDIRDVEFIKQLALHHRHLLMERTQKVNDATFGSGASWAIYALNRIIAACDGERDPAALGLVPKAPSAERPVQEELFKVE